MPLAWVKVARNKCSIDQSCISECAKGLWGAPVFIHQNGKNANRPANKADASTPNRRPCHNSSASASAGNAISAARAYRVVTARAAKIAKPTTSHRRSSSMTRKAKNNAASVKTSPDPSDIIVSPARRKKGASDNVNSPNAQRLSTRAPGDNTRRFNSNSQRANDADSQLTSCKARMALNPVN